MSKLFKQFHTMAEYEKSKISFTTDNSSYVYGTDFSKVYAAGDDKSDIVTYNTICFIDENKEIFRNCANYSGLGKYAYAPENGTYLEVKGDDYIHHGISLTNTAYGKTISSYTYVSGKKIDIKGTVTNQSYSGNTNINNCGFSVNTFSTDNNSTYYAYLNAISNSNGGLLSFANYGTWGAYYNTPSTSMSLGFKGESTYGMGVSSYNSTYVVGTQYNFYQVGDGNTTYTKVAPLNENNQVPNDYLSSFKESINYFPYDFKTGDGIWWNLNNKVLTMNDGKETTTNLQFGFNGEPFIILHKKDVETLKFTNDGIWITYEGTKYTMDFSKMIELGILVQA